VLNYLLGMTAFSSIAKYYATLRQQHWVVPSFLCKLLEGGFCPTLICIAKDGIQEAISAWLIGETGHGISAPAHLAKLTLDGVRGANLLPMGFRPQRNEGKVAGELGSGFIAPTRKSRAPKERGIGVEFSRHPS
jgi:hypothetical protein